MLDSSGIENLDLEGFKTFDFESMCRLRKSQIQLP